MSEDEVAPNTVGGWDVTADGASRASSHYQTQEAVHAGARRLAENAGGGEVRIHGRDGQIGKSDTTVPPRG